MANGARGNNLDRVRRHNLSTVLRLVHRAGAASRSELTRATGLNRSTIADLVGELARRGLVTENIPEANVGVGRPSPVVAPAPDVVAIAVNPEFDAVTVGVVGLDGTVRARVRRPHESGAPSAAEAVAVTVRMLDELDGQLAAASTVAGIGAAIPALVRESDGVVRQAPQLDWIDEPFAAMLEEASGRRVVAANDANLGVAAEHLFGAGRGASDLVYVNGGASGIGAGVITAGAPLAGHAGYAGELGHTLVNSSGVRCHCGAIGCLESEVTQRTLLDALGLEEAAPDELEHALTASTDAAVRAEVDRQLRFLAVALRNAVNMLNPQLVVLGGFLRALVAAHPGHLEELLAERALAATGEFLRVEPALLGADLLMIGAAERAFAALIEDPAAFA